MNIDTTFDFRKDSHGKDPDSASKTLQEYHRILWSKQLPNGQKMELVSGTDYLSWNGMAFGSDSVIVSFRWKRYEWMLKQLRSYLPDYNQYFEDYLKKAYTIGGELIFPKTNSINRSKGMNHQICDRLDLTLECIRRFYENEISPLSDVMKKNKEFFDLFVDFKGYVDYFFLQDLVSADYKKVNLWLETELFVKEPLPKTVDEYLKWIELELEFTAKRNERIKEYLSGKKYPFKNIIYWYP